MESYAKTVISALTGLSMTRILDSVKRDKILGRDFKDHARTLQRNISIIEGYRDAFILEDKNIWNWYMDLQDVMYHAIDALDVYVTAIERGSTDTLLDGLKNFVYTLSIHQVKLDSSLPVARTIELINQRINKLLKEGRTHGYQEMLKSEVTKYPEVRPRPTSMSDDYPIIDRDETKKDIIAWLRAGHSGRSAMRLQILPIVGMGGIGKTTLVQSILASEKQSFGLCGWVHSPSKTINTESVLRDILLEFQISDPGHSCNLVQLTTKVEHAVRNKKFLLIIDDAWSNEQQRWSELLTPLKGGLEGKLIITTRDMDVVKNIEKCHRGGVEAAVELGGLKDESLWEILKNHAFGVNGPNVPGYAERIGREIVPRLEGLPLAAKAIGCLLGDDQTEKNWKRIQDSNLWDALKSKDVDLVPALIISILHLPPEAKPCFAYFATFPRHAVPSFRELVYQWLALGYLQDDGSVESAGARIINYLESMSLVRIQSDKYGVHGSPVDRIINMHDLIYDTSRALGRDNHLQMIDDRNIDKLPVDTLRHLCISTQMLLPEESLEKLGNCTKLRTLIVMANSCPYGYGIDRILGMWLEKLKSLRVLTLPGSGIRELPNEIGELKHLRYLDLSNNSIKCLPGTMAELHHLQVLKLRGVDEAEGMKVLGKLTKLRYLALSYCTFRSLEFITLLSDLQVLSLRGCHNVPGLPDGISNVKRLECLELHGNDDIRKLLEGLASLSCLRVLYIMESDYASEMTTLPSNFNDLKNLSRLYLPGYLLNSISGIGKLTSLQNLGEFRIQEKEGHKIEELADLNMLCEELKIKNLDLVKSKSEAQRTQLEQKVKLEKLELQWNPDDDGTRDVIIEEAIIEGLKPSRDLKGLTIKNYMGKKLPAWLTNEYLRFLKRCCLSDLLNIDLIDWLVPAPSKSNKRKRSERLQEIFPFMEELEFSNLPKLTAWPGVNNTDQWIFPRVRKIKIHNCPMLKSMPAIALSLKVMVLVNVGFSELPRLQCRRDPVDYSSPSGSSSSSLQGASLTHVVLKSCPFILSLNDGVLQQQLPNLRQLFIFNCENLRHPPHNGFREFKSLESLLLSDCPMLPKLSVTSDPALPAQLRSLEIANCINLDTESLHKSLKALTSLQILHVEDCPQLPISFFKYAVALHLKTIRDCKIEVGDSSLQITIRKGASVDTGLFGEDDETGESVGEKATEERDPGCCCTELLAVIFRNIPSTRIDDLYLYGYDSDDLDAYDSDDLDGEDLDKCADYNTCIYLDGLESLPVDISRFSSLKELHIDSLDNFCPPDQGWALVEPGEAFLGLTSVKNLKISNCNRLRSLPYSNFLERLEVTHCYALVNISSLGSPMPYIKTLVISCCANLENPPERGFVMLDSLYYLGLINCPKLSKLSEKEQYSDLPASLAVLRIKDCKRLQFEHIEDCMSDLKALRMLTIMNCGGRVTKSFVKRVLLLFGPENPFQCRIMSTEFSFQWLYKSDPIKRSTVSWIVRSEEDTGDLSNLPEFLGEMLRTMSRYNIKDLTISGIHELDALEGNMKEILLGLTGLLSLTIADCRNLRSLPVADITSRITTIELLDIKKCPKLHLLDTNEVPYAITLDESSDEETDWEDEEREDAGRISV